MANAAVSWVVVSLMAIMAAFGVRRMRHNNAEKMSVLRSYEGQRMVVVRHADGRMATPTRVDGVLRSIRHHGIGVDMDGGVRYIPVAAIRGLETPGGSRVAEWR